MVTTSPGATTQGEIDSSTGAGPSGEEAWAPVTTRLSQPAARIAAIKPRLTASAPPAPRTLRRNRPSPQRECAPYPNHHAPPAVNPLPKKTPGVSDEHDLGGREV